VGQLRLADVLDPTVQGVRKIRRRSRSTNCDGIIALSLGLVIHSERDSIEIFINDANQRLADSSQAPKNDAGRGRIAGLLVFDFDNVGAKIREEESRERTRHFLRDLDDLDTCEWFAHRQLPPSGVAGSPAHSYCHAASGRVSNEI
jgi:hypothetical protein